MWLTLQLVAQKLILLIFVEVIYFLNLERSFYSNICHYFCFVFFYFDKLLSSSLLPTSNIPLSSDKMNWSLTYFSSSLLHTMRLILLASYMFFQMWTVLWYRSTSFDWKLRWLDSKNVWSVRYVFNIICLNAKVCHGTKSMASISNN